MRRILLIIPCLMFSAVLCFSAEQKIAIVRTEKRTIAFYDEALEGFKKFIRKRINSVTFKEYDLNENGVIDKIKNEKVNLIFTLGTSDTKLVADNINDIPIVFSVILYPRENDITGKNVTGSSLDIPIETQFEKLKMTIPKVKRIGVIYSSKENKNIVEKAKEVTQNMGFTIEAYPVKSAEEIPKIEEMKIDILWLIPDIIVCQPVIVKHILYSGLKSKIPVIGISPSYVKAGAIMALSCDYEDIGKQSGEIAEKILNGESPDTIQINVPRKIRLYLNLNVADKLKIKIANKIVDEAEEIFGR